MATTLTFIQAVQALSMIRALPEGQAPDTDEMEKIVLDHRPATPAEAALILEEVAYNLEAGARSDTRDTAALRRVGRWLDLGQDATLGGAGPAPSAAAA